MGEVAWEVNELSVHFLKSGVCFAWSPVDYSFFQCVVDVRIDDVLNLTIPLRIMEPL